jgi:acyl-CoA synthetase (AMP-forming)/AMP-acid ligase II
MITVANILRIIEKNGDSPFLINDNLQHTYKSLDQAIDEIRSKALVSIPEQSIVVLIGDFNITSIATLFSLVAEGCHVIPLTSESFLKGNLTLNKLGYDYIIDCTDSNSTSKSIMKHENKTDHDEKPTLHSVLQSIDSGIVFFTSGSTGAPKAIVHDCERLFQKFRKPRPAYRTIPFLRFDHMGGINTLLSIITSGGSIVIPPSHDPRSVMESIEMHKVELLPTTPTFLNLLLASNLYTSYNLQSLKLITYGSELMSSAVLEKLSAVFPNIRFKQTYGMSEFGVIPTSSKDTRSTWMTITDSDILWKVEEGRLFLQVPSQMLGYFELQDSQGLVWCQPKAGWFDTGDMVELKDNYFRFIGRKSDIISISGLKVFPSEIEDCLLKSPIVDDVTVRGEKNLITGQVIIADIVLKPHLSENEARASLIQHCQTYLPKHQRPIRYKFHQKLEVTSRFKKSRGSHASN